MQRACNSCGETYEAKRKTSKFCSDRCRVRGARGGVASLPEVPDAPRLGVLDATRAELLKVERADTALGRAALALATRIDVGRDTGSALAAVTKEWRATLAAATEGAKQAASPLDELRAKREARRGA